MMKQKHAFLTALLCLCLALMTAGAAAEQTVTVADIPKYGNLTLSISASDFFAMGYAYGDVVTVTLGGEAYDMPVCSNYTDVDTGSLVCRAVLDAQTGEDGVTLAICMGDLATFSGIARKTTIEEAPGYRWDYIAEAPVTVTFAMKEQGGYAAEYELRQLTRTNDRADYPHLTDEAFANFRAIATTGMGEGRLYRSSSPVNPELNRSAYADAALKAAGVRTVINLADSEDEMRAYEGFAGTAYASCDVIALCLSTDVTAEDFQAGLAKGLRFMLAHEGPYLVHCTEGKDRAGFVSAVLSSLMGATAEEVVADYMTTFANYYGVEPGSETWNRLAERNICKLLSDVFEVEDVTAQGVDLAAEATDYMTQRLQLTEAEVHQLREVLGQ